MRVGEIWKLKRKYEQEHEVLSGLKVQITKLYKNVKNQDFVTAKIFASDITKQESNVEMVQYIMDGIEEICLRREEFIEAYVRDYESI